ncbi:TPA: hypothetical protein ACH3X1_013603 [Trebouxia sp. C0004]
MQVYRDRTSRHCSTAHGRMHFSLVSVVVQNRMTSGLYHCKYTFEDLLFIRLCSDPTPVHYNTVLGKKQSPLSIAAVQNRLTAGLYHCKYTCEDLLFEEFMQVQQWLKSAPVCLSLLVSGTAEHISC